MKYRRTIVVGRALNQAIAKTALATSDALNMDLSKTDPSVETPLNRYSFRAVVAASQRPLSGDRPSFGNEEDNS
jgi:hypothetical protein